MVKRKLTVGGLIGHLASVSRLHKKEYNFRRFPFTNISHMQFL